jgi:hypothetical protein
VRVTDSAGMCCHRPRPRASRRSCSSASLPTMHRARVNAHLSRAACDAIRCDACAFERHLAEWRLGWALRCLACLARLELRHRCQRCAIAASAAPSLPALRHRCHGAGRFPAVSLSVSLKTVAPTRVSVPQVVSRHARHASAVFQTSHTRNCAHARARTHTLRTRTCTHAHTHTLTHAHTHAHKGA